MAAFPNIYPYQGQCLVDNIWLIGIVHTGTWVLKLFILIKFSYQHQVTNTTSWVLIRSFQIKLAGFDSESWCKLTWLIQSVKFKHLEVDTKKKKTINVILFVYTFPVIRRMASDGNHSPTDLPKPIIFAGPSGSGKSTLIKMLKKDHGDFMGFSVSREYHIVHYASL